MKERFFKPSGIYYRTNVFRADRPTIVFVHGLSGSSSAWLQYEEYFLKNYNVLSFDLRGHGKSLKWPHYEDYKIDYLAEDLEKLAHHLGLEKFILVSHSFGTYVALAYILAHQDKVSASVFLSPGFYMYKNKTASFVRLLSKATRLIDRIPFDTSPGMHINYDLYKGTHDWTIRRMIADIGNTRLRPFLYCICQSAKYKGGENLHNIRVPVLLVHGNKDTVFDMENSLRGRKEMPRAIMRVIDNTDHIVVLNNFNDVVGAIDEFISGSLPLPNKK